MKCAALESQVLCREAELGGALGPERISSSEASRLTAQVLGQPAVALHEMLRERGITAPPIPRMRS